MREKLKSFLNFKNNETHFRLSKIGFKRIVVVAALIWLVNLYNVIFNIKNLSPANDKVTLMYLILNGVSMLIMIIFIFLSLFQYKNKNMYLWLQRVFYILVFSIIITLDVLNNSRRLLGLSTSSYFPTFLAYAVVAIFSFFSLKEIIFILLNPLSFIIVGLFTKYNFDFNTVLLSFVYSFLAILISQMNYYVSYHYLEKTEELDKLNKNIEKLIYTDPLTGYYSQWGITNILANHLNKDRDYFIITLELSNIHYDLVMNELDVSKILVKKLNEILEKTLNNNLLYVGHLFKDQVFLITNFEDVNESVINKIQDEYNNLKMSTTNKKTLVVKYGLLNSNTWKEDLEKVIK